MSSTVRLGLPYMAAGQAQKHLTHNDALEIIDALIHLTVESCVWTMPPPAPPPGARYIVPLDATGVWLNHAHEIASADGDGWVFYPPQLGWRAFLKDEAQLVVFDGSVWELLLRRTGVLGVNTDADTNNRLAVSSPSSLFTHAGSDARLVINKASETDVGTLQFHSGFDAQAEIGLAGDNDLRIKVRDGSAFRQAFVVKSGTGRVGFGVAEPSAELEVADSSGDGDCRIQLRADAEIAQLGVSSTKCS